MPVLYHAGPMRKSVHCLGTAALRRKFGSISELNYPTIWCFMTRINILSLIHMLSSTKASVDAADTKRTPPHKTTASNCSTADLTMACGQTYGCRRNCQPRERSRCSRSKGRQTHMHALISVPIKRHSPAKPRSQMALCSPIYCERTTFHHQRTTTTSDGFYLL